MDSIRNTEQIFDKYASDYQKKYMDVSLYSEYLDGFLKLFEPGKRNILDVGCGPGNISNYLLKARDNLKILGVDISKNMVSLARSNNPDAEFMVLDGRDIIQLDKKFDAVIAAFFLPYLSKKEALIFLNNCCRILKGNGALFLSTMEAANEKSGFEGSESATEKLYINYHESGYLVEALKENKMKFIETHHIDNPGNKAGIRDLIITAVK